MPLAFDDFVVLSFARRPVARRLTQEANPRARGLRPLLSQMVMFSSFGLAVVPLFLRGVAAAAAATVFLACFFSSGAVFVPFNPAGF